MKRLLLLTGLAVVVGFISLAAQEKSKPATTAKDSITVTGCLQAGTAPDSFTLSNVTQTAAASSSTGTSGSGTATGTATAGAKSGTKGTDTQYDLVADANVNLKPHVGHKVEITGTPDKAAAGAKASPSDTSATASASTSSGSAGATKKIKVTAVKHVAASCP